uniref:DNA sliding clamp PCNA n=1 Tax=Entomoneis paludosa TaxID=265537 RepID=A0A7S3DM90_9STRA
MFEARLVEGNTLKLIVESIKDLVVDTNVDVSEEEISIQCMDSAHVSLVAISLSASAFDRFRCDHPLQLGINTGNMSKIFKMMNKSDVLVLKAEDEGDALTLMFESEKNDTIADFELKLMEIDQEQMQIPDTPYKCNIKMPAGEFQRIVRDLQVLGDTCTISCTKEGIRFSVSGEIGTGNILTRANAAAEKEADQVVIDMEEPVELNFALRYLNFFTKATPLSESVVISMSPDVPVVVEYPIGDEGFIKFFLAPKIEEDEEDDQ